MKYCSKCRLSVRTTSEYCPLCQSRLTGEGGDGLYPYIPTIYKQFELFFKILIVSSIGAAVACVAANLIFPQTGIWSLFAVFGIFCVWVSVTLIIKKRRNIPRTIVNQVFLTALFCIIWDAVTGWRGWSVDYVLPIIFSASMIGLFIVARVLKMKAGDYLFYLILVTFFCIITLVFYITGITGAVIPSIICFSGGIATLASLVIFEGRNMKHELERRFHL